MYKVLIGLVAISLIAGNAYGGVGNPEFAPEQIYQGAGDGNQTDGPDGWTLRDMEGRAVVSTVDFAKVGERVFWFETPTRGYGDNKLDQCMAIADHTFELSFNTWSAVSDSNLRARVNVESYKSSEACDERDTSDREDNVDFDFNLDGTAEQWHQYDLAHNLDPTTTHVRISLRVRDRTDGGEPADPPIQVFFDDIKVTGATLVNGDFEDTIFTEANLGGDPEVMAVPVNQPLFLMALLMLTLALGLLAARRRNVSQY